LRLFELLNLRFDRVFFGLLLIDLLVEHRLRHDVLVVFAQASLVLRLKVGSESHCVNQFEHLILRLSLLVPLAHLPLPYVLECFFLALDQLLLLLVQPLVEMDNVLDGLVLLTPQIVHVVKIFLVAFASILHH